MILGLAIIPLFAAIGLAIDSGRGYLVESKLQAAIDAAGPAGGRFGFKHALMALDAAVLLVADDR